MQPLLHYSLHFIFPLFIALLLFRDQWKKAWLILLLTMLVDLDHLFVRPVFDPARCSIGFHYLHSFPAIALYCILLFNKRTRIAAVGLLFHMLTDLIDCLWTFSHCHACMLQSKLYGIYSNALHFFR